MCGCLGKFGDYGLGRRAALFEPFVLNECEGFGNTNLKTQISTLPKTWLQDPTFRGGITQILLVCAESVSRLAAP